MQPERQIAVFCVMLGGAFAAPEVGPLLKHPDAVPSGLFIAGGIISALGIFFGTLLALDTDPPWWRWLTTGFWGLVAFVDCACMQLGALRAAAGSIRFYVCEIAGALPLVVFGLVLFLVSQAQKKC